MTRGWSAAYEQLDHQRRHVHTPPTSPGTTFIDVTGGRILPTDVLLNARRTQSGATARRAAILKRLRGQVAAADTECA